MKELKPCPFCGSEDISLEDNYGRYGWFVGAVCGVCGARSRNFRVKENSPDGWAEAESRVATVWNVRR